MTSPHRSTAAPRSTPARRTGGGTVALCVLVQVSNFNVLRRKVGVAGVARIMAILAQRLRELTSSHKSELAPALNRP